MFQCSIVVLTKLNLILQLK